MTDIRYEWRDYRPEGWNDQLEATAENQWTREQIAGWYIYVPYDRAVSVRDWCDETCQGPWDFWPLPDSMLLRIDQDNDFSVFTLRWI